MRPVLLLEINEVPIRVWKKYGADPRYPMIARLLQESALVETLNTDGGELSPWCTWPTFHRGISKREHEIHNLGQDPATFRGTPIWEEYRKRGHNVGVFGSLQSWPPQEPGEGGFYVPDTFASDARCIPDYLEPVQAFNLAQVRANARVMANKALAKPAGLGLLRAFLRAGVSYGTIMRLIWQLVAEKFSPSLRERRVTFQALIFWDIFHEHFDPLRPPAFTTFFTNHIASVMHRFWNHIFPEDFPAALRPHENIHAETMEFAMEALEQILADAFRWCDQNPDLLLVVANSMGQAAVVREKHEGFEFLLKEPLALLKALQPEAKATQNLAMMPQVALEFPNEGAAKAAADKLQRITTLWNNRLIGCDVRGNTVSVTCFTPKEKEIESGEVLVDGEARGFSALGFVKIAVDPGTAYHVPEGAMFVYGLGEQAPLVSSVDATQAKALIMEWSGLRL